MRFAGLIPDWPCTHGNYGRPQACLLQGPRRVSWWSARAVRASRREVRRDDDGDAVVDVSERVRGRAMMVHDYSQVRSAPSGAVSCCRRSAIRRSHGLEGCTGRLESGRSVIVSRRALRIPLRPMLTPCRTGPPQGQGVRRVRRQGRRTVRRVPAGAVVAPEWELGGQRPDHAPDALHQRLVPLSLQEPLVGDEQVFRQALPLSQNWTGRLGAPPVRQDDVGAGVECHQMVQGVVRHIGLSDVAAIFR